MRDTNLRLSSVSTSAVFLAASCPSRCCLRSDSTTAILSSENSRNIKLLNHIYTKFCPQSTTFTRFQVYLEISHVRRPARESRFSTTPPATSCQARQARAAPSPMSSWHQARVNNSFYWRLLRCWYKIIFKLWHVKCRADHPRPLSTWGATIGAVPWLTAEPGIRKQDIIYHPALPMPWSHLIWEQEIFILIQYAN